jgi:hypothetical protein
MGPFIQYLSEKKDPLEIRIFRGAMENLPFAKVKTIIKKLI